MVEEMTRIFPHSKMTYHGRRVVPQKELTQGVVRKGKHGGQANPKMTYVLQNWTLVFPGALVHRSHQGLTLLYEALAPSSWSLRRYEVLLSLAHTVHRSFFGIHRVTSTAVAPRMAYWQMRLGLTLMHRIEDASRQNKQRKQVKQH